MSARGDRIMIKPTAKIEGSKSGQRKRQKLRTLFDRWGLLSVSMEEVK